VLDFIGTGGQVVCPPSPHPSEELREWSGGQPGRPAVVPFEKLWDATLALAAECGCTPPCRADEPGPDVSRHALESEPTDGLLRRVLAYLGRRLTRPSAATAVTTRRTGRPGLCVGGSVWAVSAASRFSGTISTSTANRRGPRRNCGINAGTPTRCLSANRGVGCWRTGPGRKGTPPGTASRDLPNRDGAATPPPPLTGGGLGFPHEKRRARPVSSLC
jgi:hypothetical protein